MPQLPHIITTMADTIDLGCTVCPDGTLKDASEIDWHHDKDNEMKYIHLISTSQMPSIPH